MKYCYKKTKEPIDKPTSKKCVFVWFLVFITLCVNVFFAVQTSSMGVDISFYEDEINELEKNNEELSIRMVNSTSLSKLSKASEEYGFKKIENTMYVEQTDSFAKAQ